MHGQIMVGMQKSGGVVDAQRLEVTSPPDHLVGHFAPNVHDLKYTIKQESELTKTLLPLQQPMGSTPTVKSSMSLISGNLRATRIRVEHAVRFANPGV